MDARIALLPFTLALLATPGFAEEQSATMRVSLVVRPSCSVNAGPMAFHTRAGDEADARSQIAVSCNGDVPFAVALDEGAHSNGGQRQLAGEGGFVAYDLYRDPARQERWNAGEVVTATTSKGEYRLAAYGRVAGDATTGARGRYTDTVTVTVAF